MKVLNLRFQNLNSLEGEWQIDFTHPAYQTTNIFGITGPTGSGKTTILDAICLALYGRTPRLKNISKSVNEILTRQTGFCYSEITFETPKGQYRCHWSQHRARKKPEGDLQQPRHEIVDSINNKVLENKIKDVTSKVAEVTGMNFGQFTRSILLAQGSFAAFLMAPSDERAPTLEQITGTGIYSEISKKVHERTSKEETDFKIMAKDIDNIAVLTEEEAETLQLLLVEEHNQSTILQKRLGEIQSILASIKTISTLEADIAIIEKDHLEINQLLKQEEPNKHLITRANIATQLKPQHVALVDLRKLQLAQLEELSRKAEQRHTLTDRFETLTQRSNKVGEQLKSTEKDLLQETIIARTIREMDLKISEAQSRLVELKNLCKDLEGKQSKYNISLILLQKEIDKKKSALEQSNEYLQTWKADEGLIENLAVFKEKFNQLHNISQKHDEQSQNITKNKALQKKSEDLYLELKNKQSLYEKNHAETAIKLKKSIEESNEINAQYPNVVQNIEEFGNRIHLFEKIEGHLNLREESENSQKQVSKNLENLKTLLTRQQTEKQLIEDRLTSQREIVTKQQEIVYLSNRISSYEEERNKLEDGSPCPLCGATKHPFSIDTPRAEDNATKVLEKEKLMEDNLHDQLISLKTQISIELSQQQEAEKQFVKIGVKLEDVKSNINTLRQSLKISTKESDKNMILQGLSDNRDILLKYQDAARQIDKLNTDISRLRNEIDEKKELVNSAERSLQQSIFEQQTLSERSVDLTKQQKEFQLTLSSNISDLIIALSPYGFNEIDQYNFVIILDQLTTRQKNWKTHSKNLAVSKEEIQQNLSEIEKIRILLTKLNEDSTKIHQDILQKVADIDILQEKRHSIYGDKNPDVEEKRYELKRRKATTFLKETEEQLILKGNNLAVVQEQYRALKDTTNERKIQLQNDERHFATLLKANDFQHEDEFVKIQMSEEQLNKIVSHLNDLENKQQKITTLLTEKKRQLKILKKETKILEEQEILKNELTNKNQSLSERQQEIGKIQGKLQENSRLLAEQEDKRKALADQKKEMQRWQRLDNLIGSANGKKFRNFAQGITFEIMVQHANRNLQKMSDRYILLRDKNHPLELNVMDNYRGGDVRTTKNLSGGESFLVSLALALGLSNMASKNVRVDSLFLDEGFGTLDEETLETALQTLASLQQEGKNIGIISHIALLRDRLDTRIQVSPGLGGHSRLIGPGITFN